MTVALLRLRWLAPAGVLLLAAALRLWALARPEQLVFDEIYYVRDAVSQLAHGFPTTWPQNDATFASPWAYTDQAANVVHPPLGKWLIALGMLVFGVDSAWGWRIVVGLAGVATVAVTMRLGWLMSRSLTIACLAGLLLAVDGVHVVLSRVGLLDGLLTLLIALGALCIWHDQDQPPPATGLAWRRPWLLAAGVVFGAAAAVKWSGLYPLAAFLVIITVRDLVRRWRTRRHTGGRPVLGALRQAVVTASLTLPIAAVTYLATWLGWLLHPQAQQRDPGEPWWVSLWQWHRYAYDWHAHLNADHPYRAHPLSWPLDLKPTAMYREFIATGAGCSSPGGCVATITTLPNAFVTWGGVVALLLLCAFIVRGVIRAGLWRDHGVGGVAGGVAGLWAAVFVVTGYLSGWLPWLLTLSRSATFEYYAVVLTPFAALSLALVLGRFARLGAGAGVGVGSASVRARRVAVAIFVAGCVVLGALYFPLWSGMPVAEWFWRAHLWLPDWS